MLRLRHRLPRALWAAALAAGVFGAAQGCNVSAAVPGGSSPETTVYNAAGSDAGDAALLAIDAGTAADATGGSVTGSSSPLCSASQLANDCDPDVPVMTGTCWQSPDGGGNPSLACRVTPAMAGSANDAPSTSCYAAGIREDGAGCGSSSDCASGFDCVGSEVSVDGGTSARGTCRHYCCSGNTQCPSAEFCDVQSLAEASTTRVPVCMPIEPTGGCSLAQQLAGHAVCPDGQTCSVVREDGSTGCVGLGSVAAMGSCNAAHCAAGLACLGAPSNRVCYTLCSTSSSGACAAPTTCQGGLPLFADPTVGVCR